MAMGEAESLRATVARLEDALRDARADLQATAIAHDQAAQARRHTCLQLTLPLRPQQQAFAGKGTACRGQGRLPQLQAAHGSH